jgi:hypothetical protein
MLVKDQMAKMEVMQGEVDKEAMEITMEIE